ncbi:DUF4124 domain-containing protein [Endozoicomonas sp. 4G]|uniref:DUF4124 domain-containing protein n=1 Tax=Endozoicomonas sp. 4G TaxID=2872754 RepID=UPI002078E825|nr:DUF4124 domain-containing protein [Endozoicomonas sp. 4G]
MKVTQALVILIVAVCLNLPVQADKVFKWVDENGTAHYSSKPPLVNVDTEIIMTPDEHAEQPEDLLPSVDSEPTSEDPSQPAPDPEILAFCERLSANLKTLNSDDQVRLNKADGSFEILDDEGREKEKERIRQQMKQFCL